MTNPNDLPPVEIIEAALKVENYFKERNIKEFELCNLRNRFPATLERNQANDPAFPVSTIDGFTVHGMTKREHFAAQALPACISAAVKVAKSGGENLLLKAAGLAVEQADLLIAELNKEK